MADILTLCQNWNDIKLIDTLVSKYRALPGGYYQNHYISFTSEQKAPVSDTTYYVIGQTTHFTLLPENI